MKTLSVGLRCLKVFLPLIFVLVRRVGSSRWLWDQMGDTFGWWAANWLIRQDLETLLPSSLAGELHPFACRCEIVIFVAQGYCEK